MVNLSPLRWCTDERFETYWFPTIYLKQAAYCGWIIPAKLKTYWGRYRWRYRSAQSCVRQHKPSNVPFSFIHIRSRYINFFLNDKWTTNCWTQLLHLLTCSKSALACLSSRQEGRGKLSSPLSRTPWKVKKAWDKFIKKLEDL